MSDKRKQVKLTIIRPFGFPNSYEWEMSNETRSFYLCNASGDGYERKQSAKRAALNVADLLGLEIVKIEDDTQ